jgi:hypothetical protein
LATRRRGRKNTDRFKAARDNPTLCRDRVQALFMFRGALLVPVLLEQNDVMVSGLPIIFAAAAQAAATAPSTSASAARAETAAKAPAEPCRSTAAKDVKEDTREIVVCALRVEGYRIDPDVLEAERAKKNHRRPRGPERLVDNSCQMVGPMGCRGGAGINLVAAAVTAATPPRPCSRRR